MPVNRKRSGRTEYAFSEVVSPGRYQKHRTYRRRGARSTSSDLELNSTFSVLATKSSLYTMSKEFGINASIANRSETLLNQYQ